MLSRPVTALMMGALARIGSSGGSPSGGVSGEPHRAALRTRRQHRLRWADPSASQVRLGCTKPVADRSPSGDRLLTPAGSAKPSPTRPGSVRIPSLGDDTRLGKLDGSVPAAGLRRSANHATADSGRRREIGRSVKHLSKPPVRHGLGDPTSRSAAWSPDGEASRQHLIRARQASGSTSCHQGSAECGESRYGAPASSSGSAHMALL